MVNRHQSVVTVKSGASVSGPNAGIRVQLFNNTPGFQFGLETSSITIEAGATVGGQIGIDLVPSLSQQRLVASISNAGTITGTSGIALRADSSATSRFGVLYNAPTGVIGAIRGQVGTFVNEGLINGGALTAYEDSPSPAFFGQGTVQNKGTIRSTSTGATINLFRSFNPDEHVANSGLIENLGSGAAINGAGNFLTLSNAATGTIKAEQSAITAQVITLTNLGTVRANDAALKANRIDLVNKGTIVGDVRVNPGAPASPSTIDNRGGKIDGDLILGSGDDMLIADLAAASPYGEITGIIDAGGGLDTIRYVANVDTTLTQAPTLPGSFERIDLRVEDETVLTLANTVSFTTGISVSGNGQGFPVLDQKLVNKGTIDTTGSALVTVDFGSRGLKIVNEGTMKSALTTPADWAVRISRDTSFQNSGSITATGGNGLIAADSGSLTNDGSIIASGTAVRSQRDFVNNGLVRSTAGLGLSFYGQDGTGSENNGTIEGVSGGVAIERGRLANSGTIRATNGPGVRFTGLGTLVNQKTGIISGGGSNPAITANGNARIINGGTINGDVFLAGQPFQTNNIFVAASGGTLNGNLNLGNGGDLFITSLINNGPGQYAGVTGTVTGSGSQTIRYLVEKDSTAALSAGGISSAVGYETLDGAKLTLTASQPWTSGLHFAGAGSVDMDVDITVNGGTSVIDMLATTYLKPTASGLPVPNALSIVSRGDITHIVNGGNPNNSTVSIRGGSTFENDGTIIARNLTPYNSLAVVRGGGTVINRGTILLDASMGVAGSFFGSEPRQLDVVNTGTIQQIGNSTIVTAVANATSLVNSGLIDVSYAAVYLTDPDNKPSFLRNSGTIRSRTEVAVSSGKTIMINEASGRIESGPGRPAVGLGAGSSLDNAGTIVGDVRMFSNSSFGNVYIGRGGTITGNLTFGDGNDLLVLMGNGTGVSGTVDGGAGVDSLVRLFNASQTIDLANLPALPLNFEGHGYGAIGASTVLTLAGPAQGISAPLAFLGDGTVINRVNVNASGNRVMPNTVRLGFTSEIEGLSASLAFVNEATLADGVTGRARSFINKGQVTSLGVSLQSAVGTTFNFANQGAIADGISLMGEDVVQRLDTATVSNEGQIKGNVYVSLIARDFRFENSGTMSDMPVSPYTLGAPRIRVGVPFYFSQNDVNAERAVFINSGTMADGFLVQAGADALQFTNSGTIGQAGTYAAYLAGEAHRMLVNGNMATVDQTSASFVNSGQIKGLTGISTAAKSLSVVNSGSLLVAARNDSQPHNSLAALGIGNQTVTDSTVTFQNSGSIKQENAGHRAVDLVGRSDGKASVSVTNSGSISADGGAVLLQDPSGLSSTTFLAAATALAAYSSRGDTPASVEIVNTAGARLSATGVAVKGQGANDSVPAGFENGGSVALYASADTVRIVNDGVIAGRAGGVLPTNIFIGGLSLVTETFLAGAIQTEDSVDTLINNATGVITGSINLGAHNDRLENAGRIEGDVYLGAGDDLLVVRTGGVFTGIVRGGDGSDRIELATTTAYAAPTDLDGGRFLGFERLSNTSGVNAYSGALTANVDVNGGYLFGRAGSALTGNVTVASGARFGSAGTVNGNIVVASGGQLAPGASPGTMTVNGNVNLNSGSTTIFELAPSGPSDRLVVNGALVIAPGATLELTGSQPLPPGVSYDLFSATTLTGSFSTITQTGAVQGLLRSTATGLSLTTTVIGPVSGAQSNGAIDYVNGLIVSGEASPALVAILPSLLGPDGRANAQSFSRLSAEAHASASQLGIEHGLAIARAGRDGLAVAPGDGSGLFTFAQTLGAWRTLKADGVSGSARATSSSAGAVGGIGFARDGSAIGAFIGYLGGKQTVSALDTRTDLDGVTAGISGHLVSGNFSASAIFAYDWGNAGTRRTVAGATLNSHYRLRTTSFDLSAAYGIALSDSWMLQPNAGFTYVSALRGSTVESGSAVLGLSVDRARLKASFIDGGIALRGTGDEAFRPWVNLGVRHQLDGERGAANAAFLGESARFLSAGAPRKLTQMFTAAGFTTQASPRLTFFGSFAGEFGGGNGQNINAGLRYNF